MLCFLLFSYSGNANLHKASSGGPRLGIIIGSATGAAILLIVTIVSCIFLSKGKKPKKRYTDQGLMFIILIASIHFFSFGATGWTIVFRSPSPALPLPSSWLPICYWLHVTFEFQLVLDISCPLKRYLHPWRTLQQKLHIASHFLNSKKLRMISRRKLGLEVMEWSIMVNWKMAEKLQ